MASRSISVNDVCFGYFMCVYACIGKFEEFTSRV